MSSTLITIEAHGLDTPRNVALIHADGELCYAELLERARRRADLMRRLGLRTAGLLADNSADWVVCDLAAQIAGTTLVPLPSFFSTQQLLHALQSSGADSLMIDAAHEQRLDDLGFGTRYSQPMSETSRVVALDRGPTMSPDIAKISYTSGTTGTPKGVCLSQLAMDTVATSLRAAISGLELRRHLVLLPLPTLLENIAGIYAPLQNGGEVVLPSLAEVGWQGTTKFDPQRLLTLIERYRPDSVILVPQILEAIITAIENGSRPPRSLRFVAVGGGHVPVSLLQRADTLDLPVYEGYGLTECASVVTLNTPRARRFGSVGKPLDHVGLRLDGTGEVLVRGANMRGYVGEKLDGLGEIATGDLGSLDADGYLYVHGRKKSAFISSFGRNVSPEWVEGEFLEQKSIMQIAIFGDARPWNVAVVVGAPSASAQEIQADIDAVNERLPDYARVGDWIVAHESFSPLNGLTTTNGRIRRTTILTAYRALIDASYNDCLANSAYSKETRL
jgi:long-chain acyl-CoA synthetase